MTRSVTSLQLVLVGLGLLPIGALSAISKPAAQIVFSELMWMGSSASSADEWIELQNISQQSVDLTGWMITRLSDEGEREMVLLEGVVRSGEPFLVANYSPDDTRSSLAAIPDMVTTAVSLPNSKLQLKLYDGVSDAGGLLVDVADDGRGAPLAGDRGEKASMVRVDPQVDGSEKEAWATATAASGWDPGAGELGTPGTPSSRGAKRARASDETAIVSVSWSRIKGELNR